MKVEDVESPLAAQPALGLVLPWLTARDICTVRALNHVCSRISRNQTRAMHVRRLNHAQAIALLVRAFPHVQRLVIDVCSLKIQDLRAALTAVPGWTLRWLGLTQVWHLTDDLLHTLTAQLPKLQTLQVAQCYKLTAPRFTAPQLVTLHLENCLITQIDPATHWPLLQSLTLSSRVLTTAHARTLIKTQLLPSRLEQLDLTNCLALEQLVVDSTDLPHLRCLVLRSCIGLQRVCVASSTIVALDLALCVELKWAMLHLRHVTALDLSFMQQLEKLYLHSTALTQLDLRGSAQLQRENLQIDCPQLDHVLLHGSTVTMDDVRTSGQPEIG
ncbi:TPA: hypothetical protein N0F65_010552 [Lagenidium giganteum]|uniref:F-box domain-containing protein n=1 Tax=Lagenidium giganteum TaxID=4803 RepID=A0AAV2YMN4_9STRA|nr:TPA: hypothetical protein N0F65_010552 [Lagenidium giganteum]